MLDYVIFKYKYISPREYSWRLVLYGEGIKWEKTISTCASYVNWYIQDWVLMVIALNQYLPRYVQLRIEWTGIAIQSDDEHNGTEGLTTNTTEQKV